ncbi:MAG TPA: type I methionyl aminopeptidase, partial [Microbacterium sp.]|nr:type I methionyl aminopeptidase [Microbacterium sp.]
MLRRSIYKTPAQLRAMVEPGLITAAALDAVRALAAPGVTTLELDAAASAVITGRGARSNFQLVRGYRHTVCASVNEQVVHGIPGDYVLQPGDILSVDAGAEYHGWNGDSAFTVVLPDPERPDLVAARQRLSDVTRGSLWAGVAALASASHVGEVGAAIEGYVEANAPEGGYGILRDYIGHGIGRKMHEAPPVFNYRTSDPGAEVRPGLVLAIEPMV